MIKIEDYFTVTEAALFLGVSPNTLRNWEKAKKIRVYRNPINHYRLYKKYELEAFLDLINSTKGTHKLLI